MGSRALGRYPPNSGVNPPPPRGQNHLSLSLSAKVLSCLVFVFVLSCLALSCPVLSCLVLSWLDFPSQLASKNRPKSIQNRCLDPFPSCFHFWIDFSKIFTPNFDPLNPQNHGFFPRKTWFFQKIALRSWHRFLSILMPTCFHFSFKIPPKSFQKSIPRCIVFSIDFCIDSSSIFLRFWRPTWNHVGYFFAQNTAALTDAWVVYVGSIFFLGFWGVLAASWLPLGSICEGSGFHFAGFRCPFSSPFLRFWFSFFSNLSPVLKLAKRKESHQPLG